MYDSWIGKCFSGSDGSYVVTAAVKMKVPESGEWIAGYLFYDISDPSTQYVCEFNEFRENFQKVKDH